MDIIYLSVGRKMLSHGSPWKSIASWTLYKVTYVISCHDLNSPWNTAWPPNIISRPLPYRRAYVALSVSIFKFIMYEYMYIYIHRLEYIHIFMYQLYLIYSIRLKNKIFIFVYAYIYIYLNIPRPFECLVCVTLLVNHHDGTSTFSMMFCFACLPHAYTQ